VSIGVVAEDVETMVWLVGEAPGVEETGCDVVELEPGVDARGAVVFVADDLQPVEREMAVMAAPAAATPARFKNCRLENLVTRRLSFFPYLLDFSFSIISLVLRTSPYHAVTVLILTPTGNW
jgi:hypothetical protein